MAPADRLRRRLQVRCAELGFPAPPLEDLDGEYFEMGEGVLALMPTPWGTTYVSIAVTPKEALRYGRAAIRWVAGHLRRLGAIHAVIHPTNKRSVMLAIRMGGEPLGADSDGFVHYRITHGRYRHAKAAQAAGFKADL